MARGWQQLYHYQHMEDWTFLISRDDLTREISLEQYVKEQVEEIESMSAESRHSLDEFVHSIAHLAQAGDSWWEWIRGTERGMQMGGLAIVRGGSIVWATMTWIS